MYGQSGITSFWDAREATVNDPKNVEALEKYAGLYKKVTPAADVNNDFAKMVAQFDGGTIGMLKHNLGSYPDHVKTLGADKFAGMPLPVGDGGKRVSVQPGRRPRPVQGSKKKDGGLEVHRVRRLARRRTRTSTRRRGRCRRTPDARRRVDLKAEPTKLAAEALNGPVDEGRAAAVLPAGLEHDHKADNEPLFQKVLLGEMSAKDFLDKLAEQLNAAQADWKKQKG